MVFQSIIFYIMMVKICVHRSRFAAIHCSRSKDTVVKNFSSDKKIIFLLLHNTIYYTLLQQSACLVFSHGSFFYIPTYSEHFTEKLTVTRYSKPYTLYASNCCNETKKEKRNQFNRMSLQRSNICCPSLLLSCVHKILTAKSQLAFFSFRSQTIHIY